MSRRVHCKARYQGCAVFTELTLGQLYEPEPNERVEITWERNGEVFVGDAPLYLLDHLEEEFKGENA